jgi:thiol-disulfide isomerase/thioredoxin
MKLPLLLSVAALCAIPTLRGQDAPAEKPAAAPGAAEDFSSYKTADDLWNRLQELQKPPTERPSSQEAASTVAGKWFGGIQAGAEAFVKAYPEDKRRWQAKLLIVRTNSQLRRFAGKPAAPAEDRVKLDEIINAADAPEQVKGEAAFMRVTSFAVDFDKTKPQTFAPFYEASTEFLSKYPSHPLAAQMQQIQLRVLSDDPTPQAADRLKQLSESSDAKVADAAKRVIEKRDKMASLKTKPLDLKFTATDGKDIDLAMLRGKVVLVDFWASWCGPCIAEMPNVVDTYKRLHPKGFEIVGISLDQDKDKMEAALKKHGMEWPQYFDGQGWKNKISSGFGIDSIPAAWLIDKKGMLREMGLRGEALGAGVEKLLKE